MGASRALSVGLTNPDLFSEIFVASPNTACVIDEKTPDVAKSKWLPLWKERKGSQKLKRVVIAMGGEDNVGLGKLDLDKPVNWDLVPQTLDQFSFGKTVDVAYHIAPAQGHGT